MLDLPHAAENKILIPLLRPITRHCESAAISGRAHCLVVSLFGRAQLGADRSLLGRSGARQAAFNNAANGLLSRSAYTFSPKQFPSVPQRSCPHQLSSSSGDRGVNLVRRMSRIRFEVL